MVKNSKCIGTVMRIIKLKLFTVPVRLHSGFGKFKFRRYFTIFEISKDVVHCIGTSGPMFTNKMKIRIKIRIKLNNSYNLIKNSSNLLKISLFIKGLQTDILMYPKYSYDD